ncbi:MAG: sigma-54-dependent Fis family transcriptional regulator [Calditrichaeota bacterium]|nr:MAG: sigma-54-dependent Fis family transcriptional regulator [Calditrichota bacterium]
MNLRVLLIDDDINLNKVIAYQLHKRGCQVLTATGGEEGLKLFRKASVDVVLLDVQMPDISGIEVLKEIRQQNASAVVIMITAYGSIENALQACRLGADDYLTKPFGQEQLFFVIEKALRMRQLQEENRQLRSELVEKFDLGNLIAHSGKMKDLLRMVAQVAHSDATVLILGESGTGKELLARAIHYNSPRREKPLITVNCPSIPENLLESELFGHVKGAFTGAIKDRKGKFELADGGTIFLDEIGDLPEALQAKLLRVLQEHEIERLGDSRTLRVDVRVIAATNKNLENLVREGKFREDLYYRLSVVPLTIPPLRERREDIPFLVDHFLRQYAGERRLRIDPAVISALQAYDWPGNVRELENIIERMVVLSRSDTLTLQDLPPHIVQANAPENPVGVSGEEGELSLEEIERRAIIEALHRAGGNQTQAAKLLKIPRHVLLYRMKKFGLS